MRTFALFLLAGVLCLGAWLCIESYGLERGSRIVCGSALIASVVAGIGVLVERKIIPVLAMAFLAFPAAAQHDKYHVGVSPADVREDARLCPNAVVASRDGGTFNHLPLKWKTYCFGIRSLERCGDDFIATPLVSMASWSDWLRFDRRRVAIVVSPHVKRHPFLYATLRWHGVVDYPEGAILYVRTKAELIRWESILLRPAVRGNTCVVQRFR